MESVRRVVGIEYAARTKASEQPRADERRVPPYVGWFAACHASRMA